MSNQDQDFEDELRRALRPVDPSEGFAERISAQIRQSRPSRRWQPSHWRTVALAASLVLCLLTAYGWQVHRQHEGLKAREQLMQALRVTSQKLDVAYRGVRDVSKSPAFTADKS